MLIALCILVAVIIGHVIFSVVARRRHPPIGRFIEAGGVRLHYIERGPADGIPVVMLHGTGAVIQDLTISGIVDGAAGKFRVICFDRPGFGHSSRPRWRLWTPQAQAAVIAAALERLGAKEPIVLGQSWGTLVALSMAVTGRARGLVLVSGYYFPTRRKDVWLLSPPAIPILGDLLRYTIAPIASWMMLPMLVRMLFAPMPVPEPFRQEFPFALTVRPGQLRSASEEAAMLIWAAGTLAPAYPQIVCPVAIVAGDGDRVIGPSHPPRLHAVLPRSVLKILPGVGHMPHHAAPDRICDVIELIAAWPAVGTTHETSR